MPRTIDRAGFCAVCADGIKMLWDPARPLLSKPSCSPSKARTRFRFRSHRPMGRIPASPYHPMRRDSSRGFPEKIKLQARFRRTKFGGCASMAPRQRFRRLQEPKAARARRERGRASGSHKRRRSKLRPRTAETAFRGAVFGFVRALRYNYAHPSRRASLACKADTPFSFRRESRERKKEKG